MKINWGVSVVLAFVCFIVFILFFVVKTFTQKEYEYDLVSSHYYEDELAFQKHINNAENRNDLVDKLVVNQTESQVKIMIPNPNAEVIVGEIHFYRPSNEKLDFVKEISSSENEFTFTDKKLVKGRWDISITWHYQSDDSKVFYKKEQLYF